MAIQDEIFKRSNLLLGDEAMQAVAAKRVIIFGVGGVGSWCAESLIRSGIYHLTIVDSDRVCASNINRQLMATTLTVGQVKVHALKASQAAKPSRYPSSTTMLSSAAWRLARYSPQPTSRACF